MEIIQYLLITAVVILFFTTISYTLYDNIYEHLYSTNGIFSMPIIDYPKIKKPRKAKQRKRNDDKLTTLFFSPFSRLEYPCFQSLLLLPFPFLQWVLPLPLFSCTLP